MSPNKVKMSIATSCQRLDTHHGAAESCTAWPLGRLIAVLARSPHRRPSRMLAHRCQSPCCPCIVRLVQRLGSRAEHEGCGRSSRCFHCARATRAVADALDMGACPRTASRQVPTPLDVVAPNSSSLGGADLAADDDAHSPHGLL